MADDWDKYLATDKPTESSPSSGDEWDKFAVSAKSEESDTPDVKFLPSSKEEAMSEAGAVGLKALSGATEGLTEVGLKPVSEAVAGQVGLQVETGVKLGKLIRENYKTMIKGLAINPMTEIGKRINEVSGSLETLNSKYGIPVPPQPETGIGKILGMGAQAIGGASTAKNFENMVKSGKFKIKSENITDAKAGIESNLKTNIAMTDEQLAIAKGRSKFEEDMIHGINDKIKISTLENELSDVSYRQSEAIHGNPDEIGLGLKASKNLNKAYWKRAEPYFNQEIHMDDAIDSVKSYLQKTGVVDVDGRPIPNIEIHQDQAKALKLYKELKPFDDVGEVQFNPKKIKVGDLKKQMDGVFGKGYGAENIKNEIFQSVTSYVKGLKEVNKEFVTDYQARNGVFDKFNIFNRIGWRKGDVGLNSGSEVLKNVANENPAAINRDNLKLMDFIKKYTGEDPSLPVKKVSGDIVGVKNNAMARQTKSMYEISALETKIRNNQARSMQNAQRMISSLNEIEAIVKRQEGIKAAIKGAVIGGAKIMAGGSLFEAGIKGAKHLIK